MLAVSQLRNPKNERESEMESFSMESNEFSDFSGGNLLDSIDFDDIFIGISDGDVLPDLEMDPEILAKFSAVSAGEDSDSKYPTSVKLEDDYSSVVKHQDDVAAAAPGSGSDIGPGRVKAATTVVEGTALSKTDDDATTVNNNNNNQSPVKSDQERKSMPAASFKNPRGKRKVKVDWTPELHRRFVQAVEQLGADKAVPSRILELMGSDCLTRHNIASHLQKYRSHRKHLLAREAEAAGWGHVRRPAYDGGGGKRDHMKPWIAPTMGFPPPVTRIPHFRPLHVWGHPSIDHSIMHLWPKHQTPPPLAAWPPAQPPPLQPTGDPSFWMSHHQHRYPPPPVHGIPPPAMIKVELDIGFPTVTPGQALARPPSDVHLSKETVDAAIGDVLSKPWLPLPLGLKPPSVDSVMVELQRQGVPDIDVPLSCG